MTDSDRKAEEKVAAALPSHAAGNPSQWAQIAAAVGPVAAVFGLTVYSCNEALSRGANEYAVIAIGAMVIVGFSVLTWRNAK